MCNQHENQRGVYGWKTSNCEAERRWTINQTIAQTLAIASTTIWNLLRKKETTGVLHSQKIKYIIVPLGVQWLVTGAVPSRVQLLYPWHRVHICTLVICTLRDQSCTCGDNFVPLFNSTKMDPSKRVQNWLWQGTIVDYDIYIYYTHTRCINIRIY